MCKSWIHISEDPETGDNQDLAKYWGRIRIDYHKNKPNGYEERTWESLYDRFKKIAKDLSGYCGNFKTARKTLKSGANPVDDTIIFLYTIIIIKPY